MNLNLNLLAFDGPVNRNVLSEYFEAWAILPDRFEAMVLQVYRSDLVTFRPFGLWLQ